MVTLALLATSGCKAQLVYKDGPIQFRGIGLQIPGTDSRLVNVTLDNATDSGDNTALYATANKWRKGATFAGVFETEDVTGQGTAVGLEVDLLSRGNQGVDPWLRVGQMIVLGVNQGLQIPTTIGYGLSILPYYRDRDYVRANFGVYVGIRCVYACLAVMGGEKIAFEESGQVAAKFDPQKRIVGFWIGEKLLWGVNVDSGQQTAK